MSDLEIRITCSGQIDKSEDARDSITCNIAEALSLSFDHKNQKRRSLKLKKIKMEVEIKIRRIVVVMASLE